MAIVIFLFFWIKQNQHLSIGLNLKIVFTHFLLEIILINMSVAKKNSYSKYVTWIKGSILQNVLPLSFFFLMSSSWIISTEGKKWLHLGIRQIENVIWIFYERELCLQRSFCSVTSSYFHLPEGISTPCYDLKM